MPPIEPDAAPEFQDLPSTFSWEQCAEVCAQFRRAAEAQGMPCELDRERGAFLSGFWSCTPPLVFPIPEDCLDLPYYVQTLPLEPGRQVLVLLQAGAAALGYFEYGEEIRTKAIKRYVVRGSGKAQSTHLKTKGKSRYGSRLRLQNAKAILEEVNERLVDWWNEHGAPEAVFHNAPVRLWADLCRAKPAPPFLTEDHVASDEPVPQIRIPLDLPVPTTDVMLRTYRSLSHGRIARGPLS
ncbi:MAG: hypothetical protein JKY61_07850 [Planctomycetes bacterium]|nr:hypothetical protein [Planctomycetota bacterium]